MFEISTILKTMLKHVPIAIGSNMIFMGLQYTTNSNCWIDFGWGFNQAMLSFFIFKRFPHSLSLINFGLVSIWGIRLCIYNLY